MPIVAGLCDADLNLISPSDYICLHVRTTAEAVRCLDHEFPCLAIVDVERSDLDVTTVCWTARQRASARVVVVASSPMAAPAVLKAGCDSVLLRPFTRNLLAARLGRLARSLTVGEAERHISDGRCATPRVGPQLMCPSCAQLTGVGFEFASHRRTWYACLSCHGVWLARRRDD
jgi:CheY-like chemotaxis protein